MPEQRPFELILVIAFGVYAVAPMGSVPLLLTLQWTLQRCRVANRTLSPGLVWLNLIPVLGVAWTFHTVACVSSSLRREYHSRASQWNPTSAGRSARRLYSCGPR